MHGFIDDIPSFKAIKSNKLLLPFSAGQLNAVRPNNGSQLWKVAFDQSNKGEAYSIIGDFGGSPVIKSNKVFNNKSATNEKYLRPATCVLDLQRADAERVNAGTC